MPRQSSPRYNIGHGWLRGEDWWGDPMSDNMRLLDALIHPYILSMTRSQPPVEALPGDTYVVGPDPTGLWADQGGKVAIKYTDRWYFFVPAPGTRARVVDAEDWYWLNEQGEWIAESDKSGGVDPNGKAYDVLCSVGYPPEPGETLLVFPVPEPMSLPANATGSMATAMSPPVVGTQVGIFRNSVRVGTVLFPSNDFTGGFSVATQVNFVRGDRLTVQVGDSVPGEFGNFAVLLRMILPTE